jgi:hypothetical protein
MKWNFAYLQQRTWAWWKSTFLSRNMFPKAVCNGIWKRIIGNLSSVPMSYCLNYHSFYLNNYHNYLNHVTIPQAPQQPMWVLHKTRVTVLVMSCSIQTATTQVNGTGCNGQVVSPLQSPNLTHADFYLWGSSEEHCSCRMMEQAGQAVERQYTTCSTPFNRPGILGAKGLSCPQTLTMDHFNIFR